MSLLPLEPQVESRDDCVPATSRNHIVSPLQVGAMLLSSADHRCEAEALTIAAMLSLQSPFLQARDRG